MKILLRLFFTLPYLVGRGKLATNHIDSELYDVVIKDNIDEFKRMEGRLKVGDQKTPTNNTALHLACQYGSINCVKQILRVHESLLPKVNSRGETALHLAARGGHYDVVVELVNKAKSLPNLVVDGEQVPQMQVLIRKASLEIETALHAAIRYNHKDVVELLVTEDPSHEYPQNIYDETPLYLASIRCYSDIIKTILNNCESPTFGGAEGRTALHAAVLDADSNGHECVKLLLKKNKDLINKKDNYGWTVLHYVAHNDHYNNSDQIHTMVEDVAGASEHVGYLRDRQYGWTALHVAACEGNVQVMEKLLKYFPASWDILDNKNRNILHIAVEHDKKEVIRSILLQGCKASNNLFIQRDDEGNTPLHLIALLGCYVEELMALKELDWKVLNHENFTPYDVLHSGDKTGTRADQALIRTILVDANVKKHPPLWRKIKEMDIERADRVVKNEKFNCEVKEYKKSISTHMIVAALIATVALTAGFAMPGGFNGNQGPTQGSPLLVKTEDFKIFLVSDATTLLLSISSLFLYFMTTMQEDIHKVKKWFFYSVHLNFFSILAMMWTFMAGIYSVLEHSAKQLAICISIVSSVVFISIYTLFIVDFYSRRKIYSRVL